MHAILEIWKSPISASRLGTAAILLFALLAARATVSNAQSGSITVMPYYQSWELQRDGRFSQTSGIASAVLPITKQLTLALNGKPMSTGGDFIKIRGMTDTELSMKYLLPQPALAFTLGVSLPSGIVELSREEFLTGVLYSQSAFQMKVPQFGQGLNLKPGVLYAFSLSDEIAAGVGLSYHYRGTFKPLRDIGDYDPGDEFLATAGFDVRLDEGESLAFDAIVTAFGKDVLENEQVYHSGAKLVVGALYKRFFGFNQLFASARYRFMGASDISVAGELMASREKMEADNFEGSVGYAARVTEKWTVTVSLEGRVYQETPIPLSGITLVSPGLSSDVKLGERFSIPMIFKYHTGSVKNGQSIYGFEGGAGIRYLF